MSAEGINILLVEDNPGDVRLVREGLTETGVLAILRVAEDGQEAIALLKGQSREDHPDLVILDLNLPRKDGREVLAEIKSDPELRHIPVVILTTSKNEQDVRNAYDLHANCFISKARDWDEACTVARSIHSFWLHTVTLRGREARCHESSCRTASQSVADRR